jgi:hypothetical protein
MREQLTDSRDRVMTSYITDGTTRSKQTSVFESLACIAKKRNSSAVRQAGDGLSTSRPSESKGPIAAGGPDRTQASQQHFWLRSPKRSTIRGATRDAGPRVALRSIRATEQEVVMPRESGASSTPRLLDWGQPSLEYWITRFRE